MSVQINIISVGLDFLYASFLNISQNLDEKTRSKPKNEKVIPLETHFSCWSQKFVLHEIIPHLRK